MIVRTSRHKCGFEGDKALELYDMENDPQEWDNLIGKPGGEKIVAGMRQLLADWWKRTQPDLRGRVKPYKTAKANRKRTNKRTRQEKGDRRER